MIDARKYIFAFLITAAIFATALFASNFFSEKRLAEIKQIQDRLSIDILASETQSALLQETSCKNIDKNPALTLELGDLGEKLTAAESQSGAGNLNVQNLKRQYSLLEIRDYLLMKSVTAKCGSKPTFILYFYSNNAECTDCQKMGYVLTALHENYPNIRIYSFDYDLDLEAIHTLRSIYGLSATLPVLVVNGDPYYGFRSLDDLVSSVPALVRLKAEQDKAASLSASSTATTTQR